MSSRSTSSATEESKEIELDCVASVNRALEKYKDDQYMLKRIHAYFTTQFDAIIENIRINRDQRQQYMQDMTAEQIAFVQSFLNKHKYYYISATDRYVVYDEIHYKTISEDDIIHHVLTDISRDEKTLMPWKQKTKVSIMKRVKENLFNRAIPNSDTIQEVLDKIGAFFTSKSETKYFLTVLGDNMLRKNADLVHLVPQKSKAFMRELTGYAQVFTGANLINTVRYKYHDHDYSLCRLIHMTDSVKHDHIWSPYLQQNALDILAVAYHYSTRYNDADNYAENKCNDKVLENRVFFLRQNSAERIVQMFTEEYITANNANNANNANTTDKSASIDWKTMQYLWKNFLDMRNLPAIIFQSNLKDMLIKTLNYDTASDLFVGISSKFLPCIQQFLQFWNETMTYDPTEMDLEIDEVATMFRTYNSTKIGKKRCNFTDTQIMDLLAYYYPHVEIESNKYIHHMKCSLWDKQLDVMTAISMQNQPISIYDTYDQYCRANYELNRPTVSKTYFEKFVLENGLLPR